MTSSDLYSLIYSKYGIVTRARNCFLYTKKGVRLTDMFQENGRAVLGWDGKNASTFLKNALNKGLTGIFCAQDKPRIDKAVSTLLGSPRYVSFYTSKQKALAAALTVSGNSTCFYRPWSNCNLDSECIILVPPFAWGADLYLLATKQKIQGGTEIPFAMQEAITRAVYNLVQELPLRTEKDWFIYDPVLTKYWNRQGPYLFPKISENKYEDFVKHCLECSIIINPAFGEPSIIPFGADRGVFTGLKNNPFEV